MAIVGCSDPGHTQYDGDCLCSECSMGEDFDECVRYRDEYHLELIDVKDGAALTIIGIDPGVTTGIAVIQDGILVYENEAGSTVEVMDLIRYFQPNIIVMEDFFVRRGKPCEYKAPIKMIGVVEYYCSQKEILFVPQSPSVLTLMLQKVPKTLLKSPHTRSAVAHLMYYLKIQSLEVNFQ